MARLLSSAVSSGKEHSWRLAPGAHLYEVDDGVWRCASAGDKFARVHGPPEVLRHMSDKLEGRSPDSLSDGAADALDELLQLLQDQGILVPDKTEPALSIENRVVQVEGDNMIADRVRELLDGSVSVARGSLDQPPGSRRDLLISCAGWLPDERWCAVDRWCTATRIPWHMCYAEGTAFFLGPLSLPGRTATYADTRARRIAAAGSPDELLSLWAYFDRGEGLPPVPWPPQGADSVIAGLLVADALAYLAGRSVPSAGYQLEVDPRTASICRHPVLPLPFSPGWEEDRAAQY